MPFKRSKCHFWNLTTFLVILCWRGMKATEMHGLFGSKYLFQEFSYPTNPREAQNNRYDYARKYGAFGTKLIEDLGTGAHHQKHSQNQYNPPQSYNTRGTPPQSYNIKRAQDKQTHLPEVPRFNRDISVASYNTIPAPRFNPPPTNPTNHHPTNYNPQPTHPPQPTIAPQVHHYSQVTRAPFNPPPLTRRPRPTAYIRFPKLFSFDIAPFAFFNLGGDPAEGFTLSPIQQRNKEKRKDRRKARKRDRSFRLFK